MPFFRFGILLALGASIVLDGQVRLLDESDRLAFRSWFVVLADAQFYRPIPDVVDCAALVRHAYREAMREHSPEWFRKTAVPGLPSYPDVRRPPRPDRQGWPLFQVSLSPTRYAEFADARTIVRLNARFLGRDTRAARPGDLLYFRQPGRAMPDHLMVFVGASVFEPGPRDWIVYHTGPSAAVDGRATRADASGEVRKTRLIDLMQHPSPSWRPQPSNQAFLGVFRLSVL
jgi:uncharacterized protein YfaT (DUF1175 family)